MLQTRDVHRSIRELVSAEEWETRVDLAAAYRLMVIHGMNDLVYNHITARVPGNEEHFLINAYGLVYDQVRASNLVKVDLEGNVILHPGVGAEKINPGGYVIHSAIHAARPDVRCIIHTHTRAGMAVSAMKCGLLPITQNAMRFYRGIGYHDFSGVAATVPEEKAELVRALGNYNALVLRNHGMLTCAPTIAEAFNLAYWLERACIAQVDAMAARTELVIPSDDVLERAASYLVGGRRRGIMEWDAMLWEVERHDPSYKE